MLNEIFPAVTHSSPDTHYDPAKKSGKANVFYAWHYGDDANQAVKNMQAISNKWNVPSFGTELGCSQFEAAKAAGIGHSYWHYS